MMKYPWQDKQWQQFNRQYQQQRIPHAILVSGVEGLGQREFAYGIVAAMHCENNNTANDVCGQCHSCQLLLAGNHPDHFIISPEETGKQLKIDQIRQLKDKQTLTSHISQSKTVIIEPADAMTISAFNSLLKLLEEPGKDTIIILITDKPEQLPITILSRCQNMALSAPSKDEAMTWLQQQTQAEQAEIEMLLAVTNNAPLSSLALLEAGFVESLNKVRDDFRLLLQTKLNPVEAANNWQDYDLTLIFNYLQSLVKQGIVKFTLDNNMPAQQQYWAIYDCIIETIKLLSSSHNLNKVLLIEQFMVSVMDARQTKNNLV